MEHDSNGSPSDMHVLSIADLRSSGIEMALTDLTCLARLACLHAEAVSRGYGRAWLPGVFGLFFLYLLITC